MCITLATNTNAYIPINVHSLMCMDFDAMFGWVEYEWNDLFGSFLFSLDEKYLGNDYGEKIIFDTIKYVSFLKWE